jgi:hypothetical protein
MNIKGTGLNMVMPLGFGIMMFITFAVCFPHHFHYREQFQMFLFNIDYLSDACLHPGGLSTYIGRFVTQFYLSSLAGAAIISLILVAIRHGVYLSARQTGYERSAGWLSFVPAIGYAFIFCDENTHTGGAIAFCGALYIAVLTMKIRSPLARRIALPFILIAAYLVTGGISSLIAVILLIYEWRYGAGSRLDFAITSVTCMATSAILPFAAKTVWTQQPLYRLWMGVDYAHFANYYPWEILYLAAITVAILIIAPALPTWRLRIRRAASVFIGLGGLVIAISIVMLTAAVKLHSSKEELMAYDYHCRSKNWDKIIEMAGNKQPSTPMTVCCLNLALYKTGRLLDDMFRYFQNGPEGLLPSFRRDFMIPVVGGEAYYYLGFVNTAQRYAFEAMEALPDYQKSARSIKRLAETNIIAGHYNRADKYISLLDQTLFYRKWAAGARNYLHNDSLVSAHPEWGPLKLYQSSEDYLFSEREKDMMLGINLKQRPANRMAYEYLLAYALLTKDIKNFQLYYNIPVPFTYAPIPQACQEALAYIWGLTGASPDDIPVPISNEVKAAVKTYASIYTTTASPEPILRKDFSNTYWYYYHFREYNRVSNEQSYRY